MEPYTLLVYKKALCLVARKEDVPKPAIYALDGFKRIGWRKGDSFDYSGDYHPSSHVAGRSA